MSEGYAETTAARALPSFQPTSLQRPLHRPHQSPFFDEEEDTTLIVSLDSLLADDAQATINRGKHRIIHPSLLRSIRRKQLLGFIATLAIAISFCWYLFVGPHLLPFAPSGTVDTTAAAASSTASETPASTSAESIFRDNSHAIKTSLGEGVWTVGKDIPRGRYSISATQGTGNISSVKKNGIRGINEIFSANPYTGLRVHTVTTDIDDGEVITIEHLGNVAFIPASSGLTTTLSPGTWVVGFDVPAGTYTVTNANRGEQGTLSILVDNKIIKNTILGQVGGVGKNSLQLTISDGQTVLIHGLNKVVLTPVKK